MSRRAAVVALDRAHAIVNVARVDLANGACRCDVRTTKLCPGCVDLNALDAVLDTITRTRVWFAERAQQDASDDGEPYTAARDAQGADK